MTRTGRRISGCISVMIFGWMVWLFFSGPVFEFGDEDGDSTEGSSAFTARCEPLLWGWGPSWGGTPSAADVVGETEEGYDIVEGTLPGTGEQSDPLGSGQRPDRGTRRLPGDEVRKYCDRARSGQAGVMSLAAVPAAVLGAVALRGRSS